MTQSASPGIGFAFALQSAKGAPETDNADFKRMRVIQAMLGSQQAMDQLPQEVGGGYHSNAMYKVYVAGVGAVRALARLEGDIGYLLAGALGLPQASGASVAGPVYTTTFKPVNDYCAHPWLTARKFIPNCTQVSDYMAEEISDAKVSAMSFAIGAGSPGMMDLALLAINSAFVDASSASAWPTEMGAYEGTDSVVMASVTGTQALLTAIAGVDLGDGVNTDFGVPTIGIQLSIANRYSGDGVRPELVVGKLGMDDLVLLGQTISFQLTYKWKNPQLYKAIYAFQGAGNAISNTPTSQPLKTPVTITLRSPRYVGTSTTYEELSFLLNSCTLDCPQGVVLSGG
ncbi:MAG: hypothetical protein WC455_25670, partial [Dehalococcoidia bacterium]